MSILILIGIIILIVALLLGFSAMKGIIKISANLLKWIVIVLVIVGAISIVFGWLGWW